VNDILAELEKQIGPLERQSETARIYLKMKEELKTYDINMFLLEEERLQERIREVGGKYEIASQEMQESNARYEKMNTRQSRKKWIRLILQLKLRRTR
jgi:chromosome segregation protein